LPGGEAVRPLVDRMPVLLEETAFPSNLPRCPAWGRRRPRAGGRLTSKRNDRSSSTRSGFLDEQGHGPPRASPRPSSIDPLSASRDSSPAPTDRLPTARGIQIRRSRSVPPRLAIRSPSAVDPFPLGSRSVPPRLAI